MEVKDPKHAIYLKYIDILDNAVTTMWQLPDNGPGSSNILHMVVHELLLQIRLALVASGRYDTLEDVLKTEAKWSEVEEAAVRLNLVGPVQKEGQA